MQEDEEAGESAHLKGHQANTSPLPHTRWTTRNENLTKYSSTCYL